MVTTKPFSKIWNKILRSNQNFDIHWTLQTFWRERWRDCFHWTLISSPLRLNCWAQLRELIPICQYATAYLNPQNLTWITNFRCWIPLADANSKHILMILVINSQNFRKLKKWFSEFGPDENITQNRKPKSYW